MIQNSKPSLVIMSSFITSFFDNCTLFLGWVICPIFGIAAIFCGIKALLYVREENRVVYKRICRIYGMILPCLTLLANFRGAPWIALFISLAWTLIFAEFFKQFYSYQIIGLTFLTLFFWIIHIIHAKSDFFTNVPDFIVFALLPSLLGLVLISDSENLVGKSSGPSIPLNRIISKASNLLDQIIPSDN